ncbi:MAG: HNH endonuclease signature motif containing protein [Candidatus Magasanikbacteria bacterium]
MRPKKWTEQQLREIVPTVTSVRQVLRELGLKEAGGNYAQIKKFLKEYKIDILHFTGVGWNIGMKMQINTAKPLKEILIKNSSYQSFKLKKRLFAEKIKKPYCELCGWAKLSIDGRVPLELDHINGDHSDNRIDNLRILCPNCHSLQLTHRGRNRKK